MAIKSPYFLSVGNGFVLFKNAMSAKSQTNLQDGNEPWVIRM